MDFVCRWATTIDTFDPSQANQEIDQFLFMPPPFADEIDLNEVMESSYAFHSAYCVLAAWLPRRIQFLNKA
jgi:hypothetical protein